MGTATPILDRYRKGAGVFALLSAALAVAAGAAERPASATEERVWHRDVASAQAEARERGKLVFMDFYATWCGWCKTLERQVFPSPEFRQATERFVFLRLDIEDHGEGARMARRFRVETVPTAILLDADLVEMGRIPGFSRAPQYVARIETQLERYQELDRRYQRERRLEDPDVLQPLADELYRRGDGRRAGELYRRLAAGWQGPQRLDLLFRLADSHRLTGELEEASRVVTEAQEELAVTEGNHDEVAQRLWLLRYRIDQERGRCQDAARTLEAFLERYPASGFASPARRSLQELHEGLREGSNTCTG